jgi:hypothetical protein
MSDNDHTAARYHELWRERDALAEQLAHEWGWPSGDSVLTRLRGDRTTALITFTERAYLKFLGVPESATAGTVTRARL